MKLNYYILWVEDDNSWFTTTSDLFKDFVEEYGFNPVIVRKRSLDEVTAELATNGVKKYDIFLIDFKLRNSSDGDSIIDYLRDKNVYTDIIFYSSDKQTIVDSIKENLFEGVYHSDRKEIEDKFEKVFLTTIKKIEEISSMRGLVVGETSELDGMIEDSLILCLEKKIGQVFNIADFVNKQIFEKISKKEPYLREQFEKGGVVALFPHIDSIRKWELLRALLKHDKSLHQYIPEFLEVNRPYQQEVINIRNEFAHARIIVGDDGNEFLESRVGNDHHKYNGDSFKEIRSYLKKHRNSLVTLKECL